MRVLLFAALLASTISAHAQDSSAAHAPAPAAAPAPVIAPDAPAAPAAELVATPDAATGGVVILIPESHATEVQKDWVRYAAKGSKGKSSQANGEYLQIAAVNTNISPAPFDLAARTLESSEGVRLTVHIVSGSGPALTDAQKADQNTALQKYVHDFAVMEYKQTVQGQLKAAQSKEKDMERELARLYKEEERANKHISDDQRAIQKATDAIATGKTNIHDTEAKIEAQKGMLQSTSGDANASKGANKTMDELEHQKKELERKNDNYSKNIDSYNREIADEQRAIVGYKDKEATQSATIATQKIAVQSVQAKLDGIKSLAAAGYQSPHRPRSCAARVSV